MAASRDVTTVGADTAALEERTRAAAIATALAGPLFAWVYTAPRNARLAKRERAQRLAAMR